MRDRHEGRGSIIGSRMHTLVLAAALACQLQPAVQAPPLGGASAAAVPPPAVSLLQEPAAEPAEPRPARVIVGADVLASSAFVWRGFVDGDSMVVQPDVWIKAGGLTVSSWFNIARRTPEDRPLTEHDLTVDYSLSRGEYTFSAGWINYAFLDADTDRQSNEVYLGVARSGWLSPSVRVFQDLQQGSGTYTSVGVQHAVPVAGRVELLPNASLGYNHRLYTPYSAFSDAVIGIRATIPAPVGVALQPFVAYSFSLDHRITTDRFYWGVGASIASR